MALSSSTVWEVRTDGSDANGGGFVTGASGTDRSQQAAAQATLTTASTVHTTTTQINVAVGDFTVSSADVGNILNINGGTATAGRYHITAVDVGNNRWTVDRAAGTSGQTVAGKMGGCLATPGQLGLIWSTASQNTIRQKGWIKSGTYTITTATPGSSGPFSSNSVQLLEGYQTTRGDLGTRPVIHAGAITGIVLVYMVVSDLSEVANIEANGNNGTSNIGFGVGYGQGRQWRCIARNCLTGFLYSDSNQCQALSCTTGFSNGMSLSCVAKSCTTGFSNNHSSRGLAKSCTTGFVPAAGGTFTQGCTADLCGTGFSIGGNAGVVDCVATGGTNGFVATSANSVVHNCAAWNNTTDYNIGATSVQFARSNITLTADPWTAGDDYTPNDVAGGGAELREAGIYLISQPTNTQAIGAVQPVASGSSSRRHAPFSGGISG